MKIHHLTPFVLAALTAARAALADGADTNAPAPATNSGTVSITVVHDQGATGAVSVNYKAAPDTNAAAVTNDIPVTVTNALRMNFHNAPLKTVLDYISARMGFAVNAQTDIHGAATLISEQPIGANEVIDLLSGALAKNGYSVSQKGNVLTISTAEDAKGTGPVLTATDPSQVPLNDEIATYILPVHSLNPTQLIKDLDQLIPQGATVAANEAGNAVIMTARQRDVHRFSEIIKALDGSSVSEVRVFSLHFADAKSVASELKEVFESPDSAVARDSRRSRFSFGSFPGGGGDVPRSGGEDQKNSSAKAVFTSDDQANAVIASAPSDYFTSISNIIAELDQPSESITVMRVFPLKYADPTETADELANLFPDDTKTDQSRSMGYRFFNPFAPPQPTSEKSTRMTAESLVRAVPDLRTQSVIVTTSKDLMEEIAGMITNLDRDPRGQQHVIAFQLKNADPQTVQAAMTALFSGPNTKTPTTTSTSALVQRQTTAAQQQTTSTSTGLGGGGAGTPAVP